MPRNTWAWGDKHCRTASDCLLVKGFHDPAVWLPQVPESDAKTLFPRNEFKIRFQDLPAFLCLFVFQSSCKHEIGIIGRIDLDVQLRNPDEQPGGGQGPECRIDALEGGIDINMHLGAYSADGDPPVFQVFHQPHHGGQFHGVGFKIIIIVKKQGVLIGRMRIGERARDVPPLK